MMISPSQCAKSTLDAEHAQRPALPEVARDPPSPLTIPGPVTNGPPTPSPNEPRPAKGKTVNITVSDSISGDAVYNVPLDPPPGAGKGPDDNAQQPASTTMPIRGESTRGGRSSPAGQAANGSYAEAKSQAKQACGLGETATEKSAVKDGSSDAPTGRAPQQSSATAK